MGAVLDLFKVLYEPGVVFTRVSEKPKFLMPFIGLCVIQLIVSAVNLPFLKAAMSAQFAAAAATAPAGAPDPSKFVVIGLAFIPIGVGPEGITSPSDLQPALGLDLLAPDAKGFIGALLKGINPFSIWGMVLTAIGIQVTHKTSKGTAYAVAIGAMVLGLIVIGAFAMLRKG